MTHGYRYRLCTGKQEASGKQTFIQGEISCTRGTEWPYRPECIAVVTSNMFWACGDDHRHAVKLIYYMACYLSVLQQMDVPSVAVCESLVTEVDLNRSWGKVWCIFSFLCMHGIIYSYKWQVICVDYWDFCQNKSIFCHAWIWLLSNKQIWFQSFLKNLYNYSTKCILGYLSTPTLFYLTNAQRGKDTVTPV